MTAKIQSFTTIFFAFYLLTVLTTDISLQGYWTDIFFSVFLSFFTLTIVLRKNTDKGWLTKVLRRTTLVCSSIVFGLIVLNLINPFAWDTLKLRSFKEQRVEGRIFHAYFKPVGAYAGGEGNFWITESPKYFPIIEIEKFYHRTVPWDFRLKEWEGKPVDQYEIVKDYILSEIIAKEK
jgi:hypothetical protein